MDQLLGQLFVSCILIALEVALLWYSLRSAKKSMEASNWPSAIGTITKLSLRENSGGDGGTYKVEVEYRYSVMGQTYTSSRLAFGYDLYSNNMRKHQNIFHKLEYVQSVKVRYNPQNPAISTLSFGIHKSIRLMLIIAVGLPIMILTSQLHLIVNSDVTSFISKLSSRSWIVILIWMLFQPDKVLLNNIEVISHKS
ncbi:hypothetical protein NIES2119_05750 [[Phormidium ambiguum] IAM M-71]|uniref:DUF3592 domain-containing protein n=1 Tax=[Phormidium ambiguum] IAM M-71 TaxID=454136 RepID=A0A1U7IQR2_9CYAN|nr:DUF3592 domain-containing protein [Phormidium ambiguum]OKH39750.1 hypothetical protein NIES2119_05750 [Phormidium ambiguum IAM M-71]